MFYYVDMKMMKVEGSAFVIFYFFFAGEGIQLLRLFCRSPCRLPSSPRLPFLLCWRNVSRCCETSVREPGVEEFVALCDFGKYSLSFFSLSNSIPVFLLEDGDFVFMVRLVRARVWVCVHWRLKKGKIFGILSGKVL